MVPQLQFVVVDVDTPNVAWRQILVLVFTAVNVQRQVPAVSCKKVVFYRCSFCLGC